VSKAKALPVFKYNKSMNVHWLSLHTLMTLTLVLRERLQL